MLLPENLNFALRLLAELIQYSVYPEEEIEITKNKVKAQILSLEDDIFGLAFKKFKKIVFANYPYQNMVQGNLDSLEKINKKDIIRYAQKCIQPNNCIITICGNIKNQNLEDMITTNFGSWKNTRETPLNLPSEFKKIEKSITYSEEIEKKQSIIMLGVPTCPFNNSQRYIWKIINALFNDAGAAIFQNIRVKYGLSYSLGSFDLYGLLTPGVFTIYISCKKKDIPTIKKILTKIILNPYKNVITEENIALAKQLIIKDFYKMTEEPSSRAMYLTLTTLYGLDDDCIITYPDKITQVTKTEIETLWREKFIPENIVWLILSSKESR
jgi:predicted Zn-dependent peptidase